MNNTANLDSVFNTTQYIRLNPEGVLGNVAAKLARGMQIPNVRDFLTEVRNPKEIASESEALALVNSRQDILGQLATNEEQMLVTTMAITLSKSFQTLGFKAELEDVLMEILTVWMFSRKGEA